MYAFIQYLKLIFSCKLGLMLCKNHNSQKHALLASYLLFPRIVYRPYQTLQPAKTVVQFEDEDEHPFDSLDDNFEDSVNDSELFSMSSVHCIACSQLQTIHSIFKYNISRKYTFWLDNSLSYSKLDLHKQIKTLVYKELDSS